MNRSMPTAVALVFLAFGTVAAQDGEYETREIADGVYMFRYRSHNSFFVLTGQGVIAFDPIAPEAAQRLREEIATVTSQPITHIVYSHHHADHISGASELASDVPIIAHKKAYERLAADSNPDIVLPNRTFSDEMTLRIGHRTVRLLHLGRNHSDNSIIALLPDEGIVFAVDFVANDRVAYRDLPGFYLPDLWLSLERLQSLDYRTIVFGHGGPGTKEDVYEQVGYWADLRRGVEGALHQGLSEEEAVQRIELPAYSDWGGYDEWFKMNARAVYRHYAGSRSP